MLMPSLTSKGQVTVPEPIRRRMGWKAGDSLVFDLLGDAVTVRKAMPIGELAGIVQVLARAQGEGPAVSHVGAHWAEQRDQAWQNATERFASDNA